jgi:hypothetical protein
MTQSIQTQADYAIGGAILILEFVFKPLTDSLQQNCVLANLCKHSTVSIRLARWLDLGKTIPIESIDKVHRSHINFAHPDYETDKTLL